ncbi:MAG: G1 family glutamic endopeptidase [Streptosporangiaceae bacterium]
MRKTSTALVAVLALCALAPPAAAATGGPPPASVRLTGNTSLIHRAPVRLPATHLPHSAHARRLPSGQTLVMSTNWSGYAATACPTCALRFVSTQFTVPSINCTGVTTNGRLWAGFWDGLDGWGNSTVEQTGVDATCVDTTPDYIAWYEMYPLDPVAFSITGFGPGDAVSVGVYFNAATHQYQLSFDDITQRAGFVTNQPCPSGSTCSNSSAEVITEAPYSDGFLPLADFGGVFYSGATVTSRGGAHGNLGDGYLWSSSEIDMNDGNMLAEPGPLSNLGNASAFPISWVAST